MNLKLEEVQDENFKSFDIPDYKKVRVIVDTDAACEAYFRLRRDR